MKNSLGRANSGKAVWASRNKAVRFTLAAAAMAMMGAQALHAAQLSGDARAAIPKDLQQIISVDYRSMQNSPAAMDLKDRVLPPELKKLETALKTSGINTGQDVDVLAFAAFRAGDNGNQTRTVGVAQGQFEVKDILARFTKQKVKPTAVRNNEIYPMGASGMDVAFLNQTTMVFGDRDAVMAALSARDGLTPNMLSNSAAMDTMNSVDKEPVWSILDQQGTQVMMKQLLGDASQIADFDTVKKHLQSSRYTMDFSNGVKFDMQVLTGDTVTAATVAALMQGAAMYKKVSGDASEQAAINATTIDSNSGTIEVKYSSSDSQFASLLKSSLFQSVVK